jgi:hypothetical protein
MEAMRNTWIDERLDDGFDRITGELQVLRGGSTASTNSIAPCFSSAAV